MDKKSIDKKPIFDDEEILDGLCRAQSINDCTGLIQIGTPSDEEIENYNDMYHFLPQDEQCVI